jgi:hypothetical protein
MVSDWAELSPSTTCQVSNIFSSLGHFCRGSFATERAIKLLTELKVATDDPPIPIFPLDEKNGDYAAFSNKWERVFQLKRSTDLPESKYPLVCHSKHGLILAHAWATHYLHNS